MHKPRRILSLLARTWSEHRGWRPGRGSAPSLQAILELALFLRVAAAGLVEWHVRKSPSPRVCIFPDAEYYWALAGTIRAGSLYQVVEWGDIPHFALRTPGYPLFLAACQMIMGQRPLGARLIQAAVGVLSVWLVYRLVQEVLRADADPSSPSNLVNNTDRGPSASREWTIPLLAALLTSVHPYFVILSALLLSEALFVPVMLAALCGVAAVGNRIARGPTLDSGRLHALALGTGMASGAAVMVRPSWALFVPLMILDLVWRFARAGDDAGHGVRTRATIRAAALIMLGAATVMSLWWIRNQRTYGRFIPTAVWTGASLYDGLNPTATGASNMEFLADPEIWPLDELDQDQELTRRALGFVRQDPGRALALAFRKLARFCSPWPNAEGLWSPLGAMASTLVVTPALALVAIGFWSLRRDGRSWFLLAGPLLYFCALHMVFASSMRYRIPAEVPAMGLAAVGLARIVPINSERRIRPET